MSSRYGSDSPSTGTTAARGTLAMMAGQGAYFAFGYLAVILLAREMGPADYGTYGVIMSVLVWIEQSARHAVQSAVTQLVAGTPALVGDIARTALTLNLVLHVALFAAFWAAAPWLAYWLGIDDSTWLFRLAAIDLPIFAAYTTLQGVYQGQRRFVRLALSHATYALAKMVGIVVLVRFGISMANALVVNILVSVVGILTLAPRAALRGRWRWDPVHGARIVALALPVGAYSVVNMLATSLALWTLEALSASSGGAPVGVYVAALNVARVPGFTISVLGVVLLPSVSRAASSGHMHLVPAYIRQAMRAFFVFYVPVTLVLLRSPDALMRWIYSESYAGGGAILAILVIGEGCWAIATILAWALVAAGGSRSLILAMAVVTLLAVPLSFVLASAGGVAGAAAAGSITAAAAATAFGILLSRRFGSVVPARPLTRIALAGAAMFIACAAAPDAWHTVLSSAAGVVVYAAALVLLSEVTWNDLSAIAQPRSASQ